MDSKSRIPNTPPFDPWPLYFKIYITHSQNVGKASKDRPKREHRDINHVQEDQKTKEEKIKYISTRKLFGTDEDVYIMDAKSIGKVW